jgi:hypothetical protein
LVGVHEQKKPRDQHLADMSGFNPVAMATSLNPFIPPGNALRSVCNVQQVIINAILLHYNYLMSKENGRGVMMSVKITEKKKAPDGAFFCATYNLLLLVTFAAFGRAGRFRLMAVDAELVGSRFVQGQFGRGSFTVARLAVAGSAVLLVIKGDITVLCIHGHRVGCSGHRDRSSEHNHKQSRHNFLHTFTSLIKIIALLYSQDYCLSSF